MNSAKAFFLLILVYLAFTLCSSLNKEKRDKLYARKLMDLKDMLNYASNLFIENNNSFQKLQKGLAREANNNYNTINFRAPVKKAINKKRNAKEMSKDNKDEYISMEEIIRERIKQLRPLLQDDDDLVSFNEENKETTIVEIKPKEKDKEHLREAVDDSAKQLNEKFDRLRTTVNTVLDSETMSKKNKYFLISVYDDLTRQIVKGHCAPTSPLRSGNKIDIDTANELQKGWMKKWRQMKKNASADLPSDDHAKTIKPIIAQFQTFFAEIIKELNHLSVNYQLECSDSTRRQGNTDPNLRSIENIVEYECPGFAVCSDNLENFLLELYKSLSLTTTAAFETYEAMYARDANPKGADEGKQVVVAVKRVRISIKTQIDRIFEDAVNSLQLSKTKNENENTRIMKEFIEQTIQQIKEVMHKIIKKKSSALRAKLQRRIQSDVYMSVGSELDSLGIQLKDDLCTMFESCNGKTYTRRSFDEERDGVFVIFAPRNGTDIVMRKFDDDFDWLYTINLKDYTNVTVTRTTTYPKITPQYRRAAKSKIK